MPGDSTDDHIDEDNPILPKVKPILTTAGKDPPSAYMNKVDEGVRAAAMKFGLTLNQKYDNTKISSFEFQGKNSTRTGNRPTASSSPSFTAQKCT